MTTPAAPKVFGRLRCHGASPPARCSEYTKSPARGRIKTCTGMLRRLASKRDRSGARRCAPDREIVAQLDSVRPAGLRSQWPTPHLPRRSRPSPAAVSTPRSLISPSRSISGVPPETDQGDVIELRSSRRVLANGRQDRFANRDCPLRCLSQCLTKSLFPKSACPVDPARRSPRRSKAPPRRRVRERS